MFNLLRFETFDGVMSRQDRKEFLHLVLGDQQRWNNRMDGAVASVACFSPAGFPVGFGFLTEAITAEVSKIYRPAELGGMAVHQDWRRMGIRATMVDIRVNKALEKGFTPVSVTLTENRASNRFFEARNWIKEYEFSIGEDKKYLWSFREPLGNREASSCGGMVDASRSERGDQKWSCGFDSHREYARV
jgi:GNAT superfamily N-acetyltransferase